MTDVQVLKW